jgi:hypothetical protein
MDPYLEGEMWQEFHGTLIGAIRAQLMRVLPRSYVALLAKRYVLDDDALGIVDVPRSRTVYPDVHVTTARVREVTLGNRDTSLGVAEPAVELPSRLPEEAPQLSIEIKDVAERRLVTVIEVLSPANKIGVGAREYAERRAAILATKTHLLEIDLVRRGARIELRGEAPPAPYYVYLSRAERRPLTAVWPVALRDPLPTVPVPLLPPDPDVPLDLQRAIADCFELVGYERLLDYGASPPEPPLAPEDAQWIAERIREAYPPRK